MPSHVRPILRPLVAALVATVVGVTGLVAPSAHAASPAASAPSTPSRARAYLSLGDSLAAGYQPSTGDHRRGGYTGVVARGLAHRGRPVATTNLGCTGETTRTMLEGGRCRYRAGSQLAQAERFLRAHPETTLVTLSLGANDVGRCVAGVQADYGCLDEEVGAAGERLTTILRRLRAAAPRARIVALDYYNPYLAARLLGDEGRVLATNSRLVQAGLNREIRSAARAADADVARVAAAFDSTSLRRVRVPGHGVQPRSVAVICAWTWMCDAHDIHPTTHGYEVIGRAVLARLEQRRN